MSRNQVRTWNSKFFFTADKQPIIWHGEYWYVHANSYGVVLDKVKITSWVYNIRECINLKSLLHNKIVGRSSVETACNELFEDYEQARDACLVLIMKFKKDVQEQIVALECKVADVEQLESDLIDAQYK